MLKFKKIRFLSMVSFVCLLSHTAFAVTGSNLGEYGTNFLPAIQNGQITDGEGNPVGNARVFTIAGHCSSSNSGRNLYLIKAV